MTEAARGSTRERHLQLEALPSQQRIFEDDYRLAEYRSLLERLYGFYRPLGSALRHDAVWSSRVAARTALLRSDLRELGLTRADVAALALCDELPALETIDEVLGSIYVIEGATLGGNIITRRLERTFRSYAGLPVRFFSSDGEQTGERWRRSCAIMNAQASSADDFSAAACAMFDAMARWLAGGATSAPGPV